MLKIILEICELRPFHPNGADSALVSGHFSAPPRMCAGIFYLKYGIVIDENMVYPCK